MEDEELMREKKLAEESLRLKSTSPTNMSSEILTRMKVFIKKQILIRR